MCSERRIERADGRISCCCKKSRCLKLYCDCFRVKSYCDGCFCTECANLPKFETERRSAIRSITDRNPAAFSQRIPGDPKAKETGHISGCHCKKSACLKKYCECFQANIPCTNRCRCRECRNFPENYIGSSKPVAAPAASKTSSATAVGSGGGAGPMASDTNIMMSEVKGGGLQSGSVSSLMAGHSSSNSISGSNSNNISREPHLLQGKGAPMGNDAPQSTTTLLPSLSLTLGMSKPGTATSGGHPNQSSPPLTSLLPLASLRTPDLLLQHTSEYSREGSSMPGFAAAASSVGLKLQQPQSFQPSGIGGLSGASQQQPQPSQTGGSAGGVEALALLSEVSARSNRI